MEITCEPRYINQCLAVVAETHGVKILHACESGSRAWGFASTDSDYDIRFIYVQPIGNYLSINKFQRSITDQFPDAVMDFHGWDIHKALGHFTTGNASFMEWINSPIIYQQDPIFIRRLQAIIPNVLSLNNCFAHYRSMAKKTYKEHVQFQDRVSTKKYFYAIRPLLAAMWIRKYQTFPPVAFAELLADHFPQGGEECDALREMIKVKSLGSEQDHIPANPLLDKMLRDRLLELADVEYGTLDPNLHQVNDLLKTTILRHSGFS